MILDALILQTRLFLSEDMDIEIKEVTIDDTNPERLSLKKYTSMIGTGGSLNSMVIVSFDEDLLNHLVEIFMDGEEVEEDEKDEILTSVTGETINTIIGLSLPIFPNRGKGITITPPVSIGDASSIKKDKNSKILKAGISTDFGEMNICMISAEI